MRLRNDLVIVYVVRPAEAAGGAGPTGYELLQLLRRPGAYMGGTWQFCGGGIEPGESAARAALRELREETGIEPRQIRQFTALSYVETFYLARFDAVFVRPGFCALVDPQVEVKLNSEHADWRWIDRTEIRAKVTWPGEKQALREIVRDHLRPSLALEHRRIDPLAPP